MPVVTTSEVAEAYSRYSFGVDNARAEVVESCFAPEVILAWPVSPPRLGAKPSPSDS